MNMSARHQQQKVTTLKMHERNTQVCWDFMKTNHKRSVNAIDDDGKAKNNQRVRDFVVKQKCAGGRRLGYECGGSWGESQIVTEQRNVRSFATRVSTKVGGGARDEEVEDAKRLCIGSRSLFPSLLPPLSSSWPGLMGLIGRCR